jgi:hypothetical protein
LWRSGGEVWRRQEALEPDLEPGLRPGKSEVVKSFEARCVKSVREEVKGQVHRHLYEWQCVRHVETAGSHHCLAIYKVVSLWRK